MESSFVTCWTWAHSISRSRTPTTIEYSAFGLGSGKVREGRCGTVPKYFARKCPAGVTVAGSADGKAGNSLTELNMPTGPSAAVLLGFKRDVHKRTCAVDLISA